MWHCPKAVVEGPPTRKCPVLLRQTSFKGARRAGFLPRRRWRLEDRLAYRPLGEIEQRGIALTPKGAGLRPAARRIAQDRTSGRRCSNAENTKRP
ncbi:DUF1338 family protein [Sinorhizobium meliloti]|nr:DUF1338 family protein [Sinorhizobium meliloti]